MTTYGPIDFIALGFEGNHFKGEVINALMDLVEKGIVRIIDLIIILKDEDGQVIARELQQLDPEMLAVFDPLQIHSSGLITLEDIELIGNDLENNSTAALMLFENLWAVKFKEAVINTNGRLLVQGRIPPELIEETMAIAVEE
jgi:hypothetical protein